MGYSIDAGNPELFEQTSQQFSRHESSKAGGIERAAQHYLIDLMFAGQQEQAQAALTQALAATRDDEHFLGTTPLTIISDHQMFDAAYEIFVVMINAKKWMTGYGQRFLILQLGANKLTEASKIIDAHVAAHPNSRSNAASELFQARKFYWLETNEAGLKVLQSLIDRMAAGDLEEGGIAEGVADDLESVWLQLAHVMPDVVDLALFLPVKEQISRRGRVIV